MRDYVVKEKSWWISSNYQPELCRLSSSAEHQLSVRTLTVIKESTNMLVSIRYCERLMIKIR